LLDLAPVEFRQEPGNLFGVQAEVPEAALHNDFRVDTPRAASARWPIVFWSREYDADQASLHTNTQPGSVRLRREAAATTAMSLVSHSHHTTGE
jgi:hypothetical protein